MARPKEQSAQAQIVAAARSISGKMWRGYRRRGENRSSFRLHLTDRTIATLRPNFRRTHLKPMC